MAKSSEECISVSMLVTQCEDTFKTHLEVQKVCSTMLAALEKTGGDIKSEKITKFLKTIARKGNVKQLLAVIRKLELPEFVLFLESLEQIGDSQHLTALSTAATHIPYLSPPKLPHDESTRTATRLKRIHQIHFKTSRHLEEEDTVQTQIAGGMTSLSLSVPGPADSHSTQKEISDSELFSINEHEVDSTTGTVGRGGACLYSPVHGIRVSVPAAAVPSHITQFSMQLSATLKDIPVIKAEYIPCSAVVSITTDPIINKFPDYITVTMPHCAMRITDDPEDYCIFVKYDDKPSFDEDPDILVDITKTCSRYISFKTKHFTRYVSTQKRKKKSSMPSRKQPDRLSKTKAKSVEHPTPPLEVSRVVQSELQRSVSDPFPMSGYSSDTRFCLGMFSPRIKEGSMWKMVFLTCLDVQTGYAEMEHDAIKLLGVDGCHSLDPLSQRIPFAFKQDCSTIVFSPDKTSYNGWSINALRIPAVISQRDVLYRTARHTEDTSYFPHCLPYAVKKGSDVTEPLCQEFTVKGVQACSGNQGDQTDISITLVAELCTLSPRTPTSVVIFEDLYIPGSAFLKAICGEISPSEVRLNIGDAETIIMLAEISFGIISKWPLVANYLALKQFEIDNLKADYTSEDQEASFQMMRRWLCTSVSPNSNLQCLLDALKKVGIHMHTQRLFRENHSLNQILLSDLPRNVFSDVSLMIASQWKCVGRLLGMTDVDLIASEGGAGIEGYNKVVEQTVRMLDRWQSRYGYNATLLKLRNVVYAVHEHSNHKLLDAVDYFSRLNTFHSV